MMRASWKLFKQGALAVVPLALVGCSVIPLVSIPVALGATALASFAVQAGVPAIQSATLSVQQSDATSLIGRGTLDLDPSVITLNAGASNAKVNTTSEQGISCPDACLAAGVSNDRCTAVCSEQQLEITIWIADPANEASVCTGGARDEYGPYLVTLDENGVGTSVSPSSVDLGNLTIQLIQSGEMAVCAQVIAPDDGEVLIDSLTLKVGL